MAGGDLNRLWLRALELFVKLFVEVGKSHMETANLEGGMAFWNNVLNFSTLALQIGRPGWAVWYMRASWDLLASLGFKGVIYIVEVDSLDHLQCANTTQLNQLCTTYP